MSTKNTATTTFITILIGAISILGPIWYDSYKDNVELDFLITDSSNLIQKKENIENLQVFFDGVEVEKVERTILRIQNIGNQPISKENIKQPLRIKVDGGFLNFSISSSFPKEDEFFLSKKNDDEILIEFNLMNPGDYLDLSLLTHHNNSKIKALGRIENIKEFSIREAPREEESKFTLHLSMERIGITGIIILIFSSIFFTSSIFTALPEAWFERKLRKNLYLQKLFFQGSKNKNDVILFIKSLYFTNKTNISPVIKSIEESDQEILDQEKLEIIYEQIEKTKSSGAEPAFWFCFIFSLIGFYYVASKIF